jgi:hypothetical protein
MAGAAPRPDTRTPGSGTRPGERNDGSAPECVGGLGRPTQIGQTQIDQKPQDSTIRRL